MVAWGASRGLGLLAGALFLSQATNAVILPRQSDPALRPWVTVAADGAVKTIIPTVEDGKKTSTFTGSLTLPTADAKGAGSFLHCNANAGAKGIDDPFCAPSADKKVDGGKTYFVTWDASLFPDPNTTVQVQGDYGTTKTIEAGHGFSSQTMPGLQGFFSWAVLGYDMSPDEALDCQLFLAVTDVNGSITARHQGPKVRIVNGSADDPVRRKPNVFGIVLPIVFGVLSLGAIGWFIWWYGRRKGMFAGSSQGYGVRKSRGKRAGGLRLADGTFTSSNRGVEMMPPPRPPPPSTSTTTSTATTITSQKTGNAFRDELNRQERNAKAQSMM